MRSQGSENHLKVHCAGRREEERDTEETDRDSKTTTTVKSGKKEGECVTCGLDVDLSNIMHHKSQSPPYWFTSFRGLDVNTNL